MKNPRLVSLSVAVILTALPLAAHANEAPPMPSPVEYSDCEWPAGDAGFGGPHLEERLDAVRHLYTGRLMRFRLASALSAQETAIGIRSDQQEAWRAYTNAVLALVPTREAVISLIGVPDEDAEDPEAFERAEALADALKAYATKAETLKAAIVALRAVLTPEQLEAARVPRLVHG